MKGFQKIPKEEEGKEREKREKKVRKEEEKNKMLYFLVLLEKC